MPAWAGPGLGDLTEAVAVEDSVEATTTEQVAPVVEEPVVEEPLAEVTGESTTAASDDDPSDEEDDPTVDVGTGDGTLDVELDVDVAPSDEDGSPQLEVDGTVTVLDQEVDVGAVTDPVEEAVDPDPPPSPDDETGTSSDEGPSRGSGGGVLSGDAVRRAGEDPDPADGEDAPTAATLDEGAGGAVALGRGGDDVARDGDETVATDRVVEPDVATPPSESVPDAPASQQDQSETSANLATGLGPDASDDPLAVPLRVLSALMVLGTGIVWMRTSRRA